jgi:hypothetical protein
MQYFLWSDIEMSQSKAIDDKIRQLDIIASKIGIKNAKVEEHEDINGDTLEFAIIGSGYLTANDILFSRQQN